MNRPRVFAVALVIVLMGLGSAWSGWRIWHRSQPRPRASIDSSELPVPWSTGYVIVPERPPPPSPVSRLEQRLGVFGRAVARARVGIEPPRAAFGAEALTAELEQAIARVGDRAEVSVHVRDLDSSRILFDFHGDTPLNPASNNKLLTGAAALDLLGADYVFETRVLLVGDALYLVGEGDPTIDPDSLRALAREVAERVPVGAIAKIVVDDSAFSAESFGPGFDPEWTDEAYMAPSGALSMAFNSVEVTVAPRGRSELEVTIEPPSTHVIVDNQARVGRGALSIRALAEDPSEQAEGHTRITIEGAIASWRRGVSVRRRILHPGAFVGGALAVALAESTQSEPLPVELGMVPKLDPRAVPEEPEDPDNPQLDDPTSLPRMLGRDRDGVDIQLIALRRSPPLIEVVASMLAWSNNFMAEQLVRTLGWRMTGKPGDWASGTQVVREYWLAIGEDPEALIYENGSGLTHAGRVTTRGLVDLIAVGYRTQTRGSSLIDALPVAGIEGTLRGRLRRSGKRVRAKTGTMSGVSGLTGVITSETGDPQVAFSIIINVRETGRMYADSRRKIEDAIVMAVLGHIDAWEAVRGEMIEYVEPLEVSARPAP
jgi:D-alanyl-D-alanine carboxypeptidase/D-alanyl-D-alanine-endopeptidase (penicillin-binding protein 4)